MLLDLTVTGITDVHASPARVWDVLTNPEIIKEYLYGTETVTDWKVGSPIILQGDYNGTSYKDKGIVLKNIPNELLSYSYWSGFSGVEDIPENYSTVTYKVTAKEDGITELQWIYSGFAAEKNYDHSKEGMATFMEQIKGIIERQV